LKNINGTEREEESNDNPFEHITEEKSSMLGLPTRDNDLTDCIS